MGFRLTNQERAEIIRLYNNGQGLRIIEISALVHRHIRTIRTLLTKTGLKVEHDAVEYIPTPEEIKREKLKIRKLWVKPGYKHCNKPYSKEDAPPGAIPTELTGSDDRRRNGKPIILGS